MNLFINQTVKHSCLFIFFLLLPSVSHAELGVNFSAQNITMQQEIVVSGTVSDVNGALPGVNVLIKGTSQGVVTDGNGRFTIAVPEKETILQFSFIGYATQEIEVGNRIAIDVLLTENVQEIEEVVVVGYAVQKKATMTGAVTQVKGDDILKSGAVTTISQAIQGLMPGVTATVESGKPGREATDILIRGKGTWHSSSPLFLVDGVERNINDIDPNEIASISVLKDAAATAVYGVKGGNGVIIVTTKRGTDQRPSVSLNANFGFKQPTVMPEYADYVTSMEMWNEAATNDTQWNMLIPESTIAAWKNAFATGNYGPYNDYFPQVDSYADRDGRFIRQINYNGSRFNNQNDQRELQIYSTAADGTIGPDAPGYDYRNTWTGYYIRKGMSVKPNINYNPDNPGATANDHHCNPLLRRTEVWMNLAEALNELVGPTGSVVGISEKSIDIIKRIRALYGTGNAYVDEIASLNDKDVFKELILNERRLEFAFENMRFWDIRRWRLPQLNEPILGIKIYKDINNKYVYFGTNPGADDIVVQTRSLSDDKYYTSPIPYAELIKNKNLVQNAGWE
jgi:TonB-dependent SusC/RagA subfamily outer membrane receptor